MAKNSVPCLRATGNRPVSPPLRVTPLLRVFERLSDRRKARGKVYSLVALLVLVMTGLLCGQKGPTAIAQWCADFDKLNPAELPFLVRAAIGLPLGRRPSAMMLCRLLWHLDTDELEAALRAWIAEVNQQLARHGDHRRLAIDGKAQRGAAKRGATAAYLPAAVNHQLKTIWGEVPVDSKTNEITVVSELLNLLIVDGCLITVDALLTQREVAREIVSRGADYLRLGHNSSGRLQKCLEADVQIEAVLKTVQ